MEHLRQLENIVMRRYWKVLNKQRVKLGQQSDTENKGALETRKH